MEASTYQQPTPATSPAPAAAQAPAPNPPAQQEEPKEPELLQHGRPTLTFGAAGEHVLELVRLLKANGRENNSIARGVNMTNVLDQSVMDDVRAFTDEHDVHNDIGEFQGREVPADQLVNNHIGPHIWDALYRHAEKA